MYVWGTGDFPDDATGREQQRVANITMGYWGSFARNGVPGMPHLPAWPSWNSGSLGARTGMMLNITKQPSAVTVEASKGGCSFFDRHLDYYQVCLPENPKLQHSDAVPSQMGERLAAEPVAAGHGTAGTPTVSLSSQEDERLLWTGSGDSYSESHDLKGAQSPHREAMEPAEYRCNDGATNDGGLWLFGFPALACGCVLGLLVGFFAGSSRRVEAKRAVRDECAKADPRLMDCPLLNAAELERAA